MKCAKCDIRSILSLIKISLNRVAKFSERSKVLLPRMFIKTGLLILYCAATVTAKENFKDFYRPPSFDFRKAKQLHEDEPVLQIKPKEYHMHNDRHVVEFSIKNEKFKLNLTPSTRNVISPSTPTWIVKSKPGRMQNYTYEPVKNIKGMLNGEFYVDNEHKAILFARYHGHRNKFLYDGVIGEGTARRIVHSMPDHLLVRTKRSDEEIDNHIIIDWPENDDGDDTPIIIERNGVELTKLDEPLEILYPKMLVVVDYHLFRYLNFNIQETVRYVATFWNVVDQKYATIESPKVQIVVSGIVIVNDEDAYNFVHSSKTSADEANIHELLQNSRLYFSQNFSNDTGFKDYDAVMMMTGLNMNVVDGLLDISGLTAKLGGICTRDYNIAITTDKARFNTLIAIHELGHLLNLSHDYADECEGISYLFGPLKTSVMSSPTNGTDIFWSECSLRLLKEFSTLKAAECLRSRHRTE